MVTYFVHQKQLNLGQNLFMLKPVELLHGYETGNSKQEKRNTSSVSSCPTFHTIDKNRVKVDPKMSSNVLRKRTVVILDRARRQISTCPNNNEGEPT